MNVNTSYNNSVFYDRPNAHTDSKNALQTINVTGSYNDMRGAERVKIVEAHYRSAAEANRLALGIFGTPADRAFSRYEVDRARTHIMARHGIEMNSPMTMAQRHSIENELTMTLFGRIPHPMNLGLADPILGVSEYEIYNGESALSPKNIEHAQGRMSSQLNSLFANFNILIPPHLRLTFTIDPHNFRVLVLGTDDNDLISRLEEALNYRENGRVLFNHILLSDHSRGFGDYSTQMTREQRMTFALFQQVHHFAGYDIRDMVLVDGRFVTPEGRDLIELLRIGTQNSDIPGAVLLDLPWMINELNRLAENGGYDPSRSLILSIGWQNGSLIDMHHPNGRLDIQV